MALRAGGVGTWGWDLGSGVVDWDASMEELFGLPRGGFDGRYSTYQRFIHPDDRSRVVEGLARAVRSSIPEYQSEHRITLPDGGIRWVRVTARVILDEDDHPTELIGVVVDVTDRRRAEGERLAAVEAAQRAKDQASSAQRRLRMLARASSLLDTPLDLDVMLQQIAELAIEELSDWCFVDLSGDTRGRPVAIAHRDPDLEDLAAELQRRFPTSATVTARESVQRSLDPVFVHGLDDDALAETVPDADHRALLARMRLSSYLMVPMIAAGRAVGTMMLICTHGREIGEEDAEIAVELGRRAGAAVEKTRLYAELQETARVLQASLMPQSLPDVPGLTLSAAYSSGTRGLDIGGDYYDVFTTGADRWWVVLGDVCGKGPAAASLTAEVRHALRAIASGNDNPSRVVRLLNDVLLAGNRGDNFTTLVLVSFVSGSLRSAVTDSQALRLRIVSGGHPPALLRHRDGTVQSLDSPGRLVGILPHHNASAQTLFLSPGDSLVLYTDGATEARDAEGNQLGQETLKALLARADPTPASTMAQRLHRAVVDLAAGGLTDDLALMVLTR